VSTSRHPQALRVVVMPHITAKRAAEFADDLVAVCRKLNKDGHTHGSLSPGPRGGP
jgi:hypothetical protein